MPAACLPAYLQTLKSTQAMADSMRGATQVNSWQRQHQQHAAWRASPSSNPWPSLCCTVRRRWLLHPLWSLRRHVTCVAAYLRTHSCTHPACLSACRAHTHTHAHCCCCPDAQAMRVMNKRMNLPNMQKILMEFEKQNERMDMTSEMMGDAIDDAMEVCMWGAGWEGGCGQVVWGHGVEGGRRQQLGRPCLRGQARRSTRQNRPRLLAELYACVLPAQLIEPPPPNGCVVTLHTRVLQGEGEDEDADDLVNQVLDEIGITTSSQVRRSGVGQGTALCNGTAGQGLLLG